MFTHEWVYNQSGCFSSIFQKRNAYCRRKKKTVIKRTRSRLSVAQTFIVENGPQRV